MKSHEESKEMGEETHHKRLVEGEHDDEFDGQKLREWLASPQFVLREPVEYQQAVQRDAIHR